MRGIVPGLEPADTPTHTHTLAPWQRVESRTEAVKERKLCAVVGLGIAALATALFVRFVSSERDESRGEIRLPLPSFNAHSPCTSKQVEPRESALTSTRRQTDQVSDSATRNGTL
ncbi:unnamed protein product [Protopolystoma xenopodis]|uniref:Transmembrane protein n=1 Tax=Protopolystoma xenopodis TaxID=117903 RepID=A0A3S5AXP3_9PLAT|nr:unnamed protein product [Protopolystoma xenopodis]